MRAPPVSGDFVFHDSSGTRVPPTLFSSMRRGSSLKQLGVGGIPSFCSPLPRASGQLTLRTALSAKAANKAMGICVPDQKDNWSLQNVKQS